MPYQTTDARLHPVLAPGGRGLAMLGAGCAAAACGNGCRARELLSLDGAVQGRRRCLGGLPAGMRTHLVSGFVFDEE